MAELPLLLFPTPEMGDRTKRRGFGSPGPRPSHGKQGERISPQFKQLQEEFESKRIKVQDTAAGADDPTKVLVIETAGSITNFVNVVKEIDDLQWMGEAAEDLVADDDFYKEDKQSKKSSGHLYGDDFYEEDKKRKEISGCLYFVMTNQKGVEELFKLWKKFYKDENMRFPRRLALLRELFRYINNMRYWNYEDRIKETGLREDWGERLKEEGTQSVPAEVELWFRQESKKRQKAEDEIKTFIQECQGEVKGQCVIEEIGYHAVLAEIPRQAAKEILNRPEVGLLSCDSMMFCSPAGQSITDESSLAEPVAQEPPDAPLPEGNAVVGILDGMPIENHEQLVNRLRMDTGDSDDDFINYLAKNRQHGTAMASLVIHGDLDDSEESPLPSQVYMRSIMQFDYDKDEEVIPENQLIVDLIHRAVIRMLKDKGASVKIINLSIGISSRPFIRMMSPLAKLLDWLSHEHNVLFVISAGNYTQDGDIKLETKKTRKEFDALTDYEKSVLIIKSIYAEERLRRIFSPAESINGITVGATQDSATQEPIPPNLRELYKRGLPSPISTFGGGYKKAIKPDLVFGGGRVCYEEPYHNGTHLVFRRNDNAPLGNKSASPSLTGLLNYCKRTCGTSNATALISRLGEKCHRVLLSVLEEHTPNVDFSSNLASLIKVMIVHGCAWQNADYLWDILQADVGGKGIRNKISRWMGYGVPDGRRVFSCTENRVTLLGFGKLDADNAHTFRLPLPQSLSGHRGIRSLTITLAWLSAIKPSTYAYRESSLWFEIDTNILYLKRKDADGRTVKRGTIQHEVFEGQGTTSLNIPNFLPIKVNCRPDAGDITKSVSYGLAVTLEVADNIPIYQEIANRVRIRG